MKKLSNTLYNLVWLYRPYLKYAKSYVVMSLILWGTVIPLLRYLLVIFPQNVVDAIDSGWSLRQTILMIVAFQGVILLMPLYEDIHRMLFRDSGEAKTEMGIRKEMYHQVSHTDYCYMDDTKYYDIFTWTAQQQVVQSAAAFQLVNQAISAVLVMGSMIALISEFTPWILLPAVTNMIIRTIGYLKFYKIQQQRDEEILPHDRKREYCHRIFYQKEYAQDLRSLLLPQFLRRDYDKEAKEKLILIKKHAPGLLVWDIFSNVIYRGFMMWIVILVVYGIYKGKIADAASYITIMLAVEQLDDRMMEFFNLIREGGKISMYAEDIRIFYQLESKIENQSGGLVTPQEAFDVCVENVDFRYEGGTMILRNLHLSVEKGEKIAIVGENGVGKSTLVKLLLRFYDPQQGSIQIQGENLKQYNREEIRRHIGIVFQDSHVYALTLRENLNLYQERTDEMLQQILLKVGLGHLVHQLDRPLTREYAKDGIELSGGEQQKLAIARVIDGDFGLLLLDEPSSALDPMAEAEMVQLLLQNQNTTVIMIAHRLSTVRNMDRIYVMHKGTIAESGTHEELMALQGRYYTMFTKQAEKYLEV